MRFFLCLWVLSGLSIAPATSAHERYWLRCQPVIPAPILISVDAPPRAYQHGDVITSERWTLDVFEQVNTRVSTTGSAPLQRLSRDKRWFESSVPDWQTMHLILQRQDFFATVKVYAQDQGLRLVRSGPCRLATPVEVNGQTNRSAESAKDSDDL